MWFKDLKEADEESDSGLLVLVKALSDAVIFCHEQFPPTLIHDYDRLRTLQLDFQLFVYQAACRRTLDQTLKSLGWTGKILLRSYDDLFSRVATLISDQELRYDYAQERESVALEVVRAAYAVCSICELPTSKDLEFAEEHLRLCCDPRKPEFGVLQSSLAVVLKDEVDDEVCAIGHLTAVQLMNRLVPRQRGFAVQSEDEGLVHIAKRISHIAELHWRVWGPILYEQPLYVGGRASGHTTLLEKDLHGQGSSHCRRTSEAGESPRNTCCG